MSPPPRNNVEPSIIHKLYKLYLAVYIRVQKFPKKDRYTIGARIENKLLEIIELIILATTKTGLSQMLILNKADINLKVFRLFIRIANKTKSLPDTGFIEISEKTVEVGKMLGGWIKYTKDQH